MKYSIENNHIAIQGWMVEDLGLRGNKLIIFAIIWGFTGNTKSKSILNEWTINYRYIEAWTGLGEYMVDRIIDELSSDRLIVSDNYVVHVEENYKI